MPYTDLVRNGKPISPMAPIHPFWEVGYSDGRMVPKYDFDTTFLKEPAGSPFETTFKDIDQKILKRVNIFLLDQRNGLIIPVTGFVFHPEIMRLILFYKTYIIKELNGPNQKVIQKMYFGYQLTVEGKNYQCVWSVYGDPNERGLSIIVEPVEQPVGDISGITM